MVCKFCQNLLKTPLFQVTDYVSSEKFSLYHCSKCLTLSTIPQPKRSTLLPRYYKDYRRPDGKRFFTLIERLLGFCYSIRVKQILRFRRKGSVLDIGCGGGFELNQLKDRGWKVLGTETSDDLIKYLSKQKIPAVKLDLWKIKGKDKFDVIMFWQTLEHLYNTRKILNAARRLLKKNGYMIIATPNFGSLESRIFGKNWFHLDTPRHLFIFSKSSLTKEIERLGFRLSYQSAVSVEFDFYSVVQSSLNLLFPGPNNLMYYFLQGKNLDLQKKTFILLQLPFAAVAILLSLIVVPLLVILHQGGTMILFFQKK